MKPLSERDENRVYDWAMSSTPAFVGMKPLSERDENYRSNSTKKPLYLPQVGMKPLSERDENCYVCLNSIKKIFSV